MTWPWSKPQPPLKPVLVSSNTLTLEQWRGDQDLVESALKLSRTAEFRMMLAVLENCHPRFTAFRMDAKPSIEDRAALQCRIEGYQLCLNNLEALTKPLVKRKPLVETFLPETAEPKRR